MLLVYKLYLKYSLINPTVKASILWFANIHVQHCKLFYQILCPWQWLGEEYDAFSCEENDTENVPQIQQVATLC